MSVCSQEEKVKVEEVLRFGWFCGDNIRTWSVLKNPKDSLIVVHMQSPSTEVALVLVTLVQCRKVICA